MFSHAKLGQGQVKDSVLAHNRFQFDCIHSPYCDISSQIHQRHPNCAATFGYFQRKLNLPACSDPFGIGDPNM